MTAPPANASSGTISSGPAERKKKATKTKATGVGSSRQSHSCAECEWFLVNQACECQLIRMEKHKNRPKIEAQM